MPTRKGRPKIEIADEVWVAAALLHRAHPESDDFTVSEIVARAKSLGLRGITVAQN